MMSERLAHGRNRRRCPSDHCGPLARRVFDGSDGDSRRSAMDIDPVHSPPHVTPEVAPFSVPAMISLQERRPRTLKHGDSFAVFDAIGDAVTGPGSPEGLYVRDTRHLSTFFLTVEGQRPLLLS